MNLSVVGLNHKRTPVEIREKISVSEEELPRALAAFPSDPGIERVLLSTCNRVEAYLASDGDYDPGSLALKFFSDYRGVDPAVLAPHLYRHEGFDAARHLFRVAAGLDSMVVGETQVLGQVKRAYLFAHDAGTTSRSLNRLFQHAFFTAKAVHHETSLSACQVSVSTVAASLAEKIFQDLSARSALVVGAGETGKFTLEAFQDRGVRRFLVANRTIERAERAAKDLGGRVVTLDRLGDAIWEADIVISCVRGGTFAVTPEMVRGAVQRRRRPSLVIDLSVPRSVDPVCGQIEDVFLYNIDDLETIATDNLARRGQEIAKGESIVDRETRKFMARFGSPEWEEVIRRLRERFEAAADEELKAGLANLKNLDAEHRAEIERMVRRLVSRLLHPPLSALQNGLEDRISADLIRRLFGLP